jgi:hypothetical protein
VGPRVGLDVCEKSRPHRDSIPNRPARSQSLYRLSYPAHSIYRVIHISLTKFIKSVLLNGGKNCNMRPTDGKKNGLKLFFSYL